MNQSQVTHTPEATQVPTDPKKPYEKPAVVFERPLETLAAACTPVPPGKYSGPSGCTVINS